MKRYLLALTMAAALAACSSTPTKEQEGAAVEDRSGATASTTPVQKPQTGGGTVTKPLAEKPLSGNPLKDPANILSKRSVYFELDSNIVRDEFKPMVQAHARYLQQNRGQKVTIQGNTDERGSREYNLALGQKRAEAVVKSLSLLGVGQQQVEAVSYGEERPAAAGHDEASWAKNRRAELKDR